MPVPVEVAVAVMIRPDGAVLLARRPGGKVYSGYWEFPGGKIDPGETVFDALRREIREELGVEVERAFPWITRTFAYPHAEVRLHFYRVYAWSGEPRALEHTAISWERPNAVSVSPLLPANGPVLRSLLLPVEYGITNAGETGVESFLSKLELRFRDGLKLVQLREKTLPPEILRGFARRALKLARSYGAAVLLNANSALAREVHADGVHLTAEQLRCLDVRPDFPWCGASCHSSEELRRAEALGVDFVVLGPVLATPSHPGATPLGWSGFREISALAAIPVYALGGLDSRDLNQALSCGAHGIAMMRGAWTVNWD
jgi:8-oxo-dGTP diphosphatase